MAMISCPHCGEMISEKSTTCAYCYGDLTGKKESKKVESMLDDDYADFYQPAPKATPAPAPKAAPTPVATPVQPAPPKKVTPPAPQDMDEGEEILFVASFKFPILLHVFYCLLAFIFFILFVSTASNNGNAGVVLLIPFLLILFFYFLQYQALKRCSCTITNKRIYGVQNTFILLNDFFCYRIDKIDNVRTRTFLGFYTAKIHFTPSTVNPTIFYRRSVHKMSCLENHEELYDSLSNKIAQ